MKFDMMKGGIETGANNKLQRMKMDTINKIEDQVKFIQEDLDGYPKKYDFLIKETLFFII